MTMETRELAAARTKVELKREDSILPLEGVLQGRASVDDRACMMAWGARAEKGETRSCGKRCWQFLRFRRQQ